MRAGDKTHITIHEPYEPQKPNHRYQHRSTNAQLRTRARRAKENQQQLARPRWDQQNKRGPRRQHTLTKQPLRCQAMTLQRSRLGWPQGPKHHTMPRNRRPHCPPRTSDIRPRRGALHRMRHTAAANATCSQKLSECTSGAPTRTNSHPTDLRPTNPGT